MGLYKLCFVEVCDPKLGQVVEAVCIDRTPPAGSLSTELVVSERQRLTTCDKDARVLVMSADLKDMYNGSPHSGSEYVARPHLAGLVTHMLDNGWTFENKKYIQPTHIWVSHD